MFASELFGIEPDLITTAKGIAGGLPLAAVTGRPELMDAAHAGGLGGTYGGNPIACAAALAAIGVYESEDLPGRARRSEEHTSELQSLMRISYAVFCLKNKYGVQTLPIITHEST